MADSPRIDPHFASGLARPEAPARRARRPRAVGEVVALLDPDGVLAVSAGQSLAALGLTVERHREARSLADSVAVDPPALVLLATRSGSRRVRSWTRTLRRGGDAPPIAWWCAGAIPPGTLLADERPEAMLFGRGDIGSVAGMVWRATQQPLVRDRWSGAAFLGRLRGDIRRYPPFRLLWFAHRIGASGELTIGLDGRTIVIALRSGTVVGVRGAPNLIARSAALPGAEDDLAEQIGSAVASGLRPDLAMDRAAEGLGRLLAGSLAAERGVVSFGGLAPSASVPLTMSVPRLLAHGLAEVRSDDHIERQFAPLWGDQVVLTLPDDSRAEQWGVDSLARGLLRKAEGGVSLDALVGLTRRPEVLRAVDLLLALGLVRLRATVPIARAPARPSSARQPGRPPRPARPGRRVAQSQSIDTGPKTDSPEPDPPSPAPPPPRRQSGFRFEARFLAIQALAREGTTSPRALVERLAQLEFPTGQGGANAAFEAGEIALAAGDELAAIDFYHQAQSRQPDHQGVKRRLRSRRLRTLDLSGSSMSRGGSADGDTTLGDLIDDWFDRWRS